MNDFLLRVAQCSHFLTVVTQRGDRRFSVLVAFSTCCRVDLGSPQPCLTGDRFERGQTVLQLSKPLLESCPHRQGGALYGLDVVKEHVNKLKQVLVEEGLLTQHLVDESLKQGPESRLRNDENRTQWRIAMRGDRKANLGVAESFQLL